jgi:alpha-D-xyloside xylohydrolase
VFRASGEADFYLPKGEWTSFWTGKRVRGGAWRSEKHGFLTCPLYVRENTILPLGAKDDTTVYDYREGLTLCLYAIKSEATREVYDATGKKVLSAHVKRQDRTLVLNVDGDISGVTVLLPGVNNILRQSGGEVIARSGQGIRIALRSGHVEIELLK